MSGEVDQSAGMLDDTAKEKGYALMCVAEPLTNCRIRVIDEVRHNPTYRPYDGLADQGLH